MTDMNWLLTWQHTVALGLTAWLACSVIYSIVSTVWKRRHEGGDI